MKNVLNAVTAILIILFFGWQLCGTCCETECETTKCSSEETEVIIECSEIDDIKELDVDTSEVIEETIEEYNKRISDQPGNGTIIISDGDTTFLVDVYLADAVIVKEVELIEPLEPMIFERAERTISDDGKVTYEILE